MDLQGFTTIDEVGDDEESCEKEVRNSIKIFSPHSAAEEIDYLNKIISDMEKDNDNVNSVGRNRTDTDLNSKIVLGNHSENLDLINSSNLLVDNYVDTVKKLDVNIDNSFSVKNFQLEKDKTITQHSLDNEDHNFRSKEIDKNYSKSCNFTPQNNSSDGSLKNCNCGKEDCFSSINSKNNNEHSEDISSDKKNSSQTLQLSKSSSISLSSPGEGTGVEESSKRCLDTEKLEANSGNTQCMNQNNTNNNNNNNVGANDDDYINISLPIRISCIKTEPIDAESADEVDFGEYFNDPAEDFDLEPMPNIKEELEFDKEIQSTPIQPIHPVSFPKVEPIDHESSAFTSFVPRVHFKIRKKFYSKEQVSAAAIMAQSSLAMVINMSMFEKLNSFSMPVVKLFRLEKITPECLLFEDLEVVDIFFVKYGFNPRKWKKYFKSKRNHKENKGKSLHTSHHKHSSSNKIKILQQQCREAINKTIANNGDESYQKSRDWSKPSSKHKNKRKLDEKNDDREKHKNNYKIEKKKDKIKNKIKREHDLKYLSKEDLSVDSKILLSSKEKYYSQVNTSNESISKIKNDDKDESFEGFSPKCKKEKWRYLLKIYNIRQCVVNLSRDVCPISVLPTFSDEYNSHKKEHSENKDEKISKHKKHKKHKEKSNDAAYKKVKHKSLKKENHNGTTMDLIKSFQMKDYTLKPLEKSPEGYVNIIDIISQRINESESTTGEVEKQSSISSENISEASHPNSCHITKDCKTKNEEHSNSETSLNISQFSGKNASFHNSQKGHSSQVDTGHDVSFDITETVTSSNTITDDNHSLDYSSSSFPISNNDSILNENQNNVEIEIENKDSNYSVASNNEVIKSNIKCIETDFKSFNEIISLNDSNKSVIKASTSSKPNESFDGIEIDSFSSPSKLNDFSFDNDEEIFQEKVLKETIFSDQLHVSKSCEDAPELSISENLLNTSRPSSVIDTVTKIVSPNSNIILQPKDSSKVSFDNDKDIKVEFLKKNEETNRESNLKENKREVNVHSNEMSTKLDSNLGKGSFLSNKTSETNYKSIKKIQRPKKMKKCFVILEDIYYNKLYRKKIKKEKKYWSKLKKKSELKATHSSEKEETKSGLENLANNKSKRYNEKYFAVHPNLKNNVQEKKDIALSDSDSKTMEKKKKILKEVPLFGLSFKIPKKSGFKGKVENQPQSLIQRNETQISSYKRPNNKSKPYFKHGENDRREKEFSKDDRPSFGQRPFQSSRNDRPAPAHFLNFNPDLMRKEWEKEKKNDGKFGYCKPPVMYDRMKNLQNKSNSLYSHKEGFIDPVTKNEYQTTSHQINKFSRPGEVSGKFEQMPSNQNNTRSQYSYESDISKRQHNNNETKTIVDTCGMNQTNQVSSSNFQQNKINSIKEIKNDLSDSKSVDADKDSTFSVITKLREKLCSSNSQPNFSKFPQMKIEKQLELDEQLNALKTDFSSRVQQSVEKSNVNSPHSVSSVKWKSSNESLLNKNSNNTFCSIKVKNTSNFESLASEDREDYSIGDAPNSPCCSYGSPQSVDNSVSSFKQSKVNPALATDCNESNKIASVESDDVKIINNKNDDNFTLPEDNLEFFKKVDSLGKKEKLKLYIKYKTLYNNAKKKFQEEPGDVHKTSAKLKRYRELNMRRKLYYDLKLYLYEQKKQLYASKKQEYEALKEYQKYSVNKQDEESSVPTGASNSNKSVAKEKPYSLSTVDGDVPYSPSVVIPENDFHSSPPLPDEKPHNSSTVYDGDEPYSPSTAFEDEPYSPSSSPLLPVCRISPKNRNTDSKLKHTIPSVNKNTAENRQEQNDEPYSPSNPPVLPCLDKNNEQSDASVLGEKYLVSSNREETSKIDRGEKYLINNSKEEEEPNIVDDIEFFVSKKKQLLEIKKSQENSIKMASPKLKHSQEINVQITNCDENGQSRENKKSENISPPGSPIEPFDVNSSFITSTSVLTKVLKSFVESEHCEKVIVNKSTIDNTVNSENVNNINNGISNAVQTGEKLSNKVFVNQSILPYSQQVENNSTNSSIENNHVKLDNNKVLSVPVIPFPVTYPILQNQGEIKSNMPLQNAHCLVTPFIPTSLYSAAVLPSVNQEQVKTNTTIPSFGSGANEKQASVPTSLFFDQSQAASVSQQYSNKIVGPLKQVLGVVTEDANNINTSKVDVSDIKNLGLSGLSLATSLLLPPPPPPAYSRTRESYINSANDSEIHNYKNGKDKEKETENDAKKTSFASIITEFFENWKDPSHENEINEFNAHEKNRDCEILFSKLSTSKIDHIKMVDSLYKKKPVAQPLIDKVENVPLVGLQYVLEVQPEENCTLENTSYICGLCSKKMSSATLVAHVKSVPHRLKYTECFCADLHEKFGKMEVKQWTAALVKEFTSSLLEVEKKKGRQTMAVAFEKSMNSAVNLLKNDLNLLLNGNVNTKEDSSPPKSSVPQTQLSSVSEAQSSSSNSDLPLKQHSKELSPKHVKRPLETNDKPGPKSSKVARPEHSRSRERGSSSSKENKERDHHRSDRDVRGRESIRERNREQPRFGNHARKSISPQRRRRSPSPRSRSRDPPRKKSRTRSPISSSNPRDDQYRQKSQTHSPPRQDRFSRYDSGSGPRREDRKVIDFRTDEARAKREISATLERYLTNPESHPRYKSEWERFWDRRCREVKQQGYDIKYFDFTSEWIDFWPIRLKELCVIEYKERREELLIRYKIDDPDFGNIRMEFLDSIELPKPLASVNRNNVPLERSRSPWRKQEKHREDSASQEFCEPGFSVVSTLKLLTNLEDQLGSLYPGTKALLEKAIYTTEKGGNSMSLFENNDNIVLLRLANVKLSSLLSSGILGMMTAARTQRAIECTNWVLKEAEKFTPNIHSKRIENLGLDLNLMSTATIGMNTMQIAQYIAQQLFNIGKSDVDETVLQEILMAISENHTQFKLKSQSQENFGGSSRMPSSAMNQGTGRDLNRDQSYPNQMQQPEERSFNPVPALFPSGVVSGSATNVDQSKVTPENFNSNETPKNSALSLLQSAYDHEEEVNKDKKDMDKLPLEELQNLLVNFRNLSSEEQQELTSYLKKLEATDNKKVTKLRSMMRNSKPTIQKVQKENLNNSSARSESQSIQPQKAYRDNKNYEYDRSYSGDQSYSKDSKYYNDSGEFRNTTSAPSHPQYPKIYDYNNQSFGGNQKLVPEAETVNLRPMYEDSFAGSQYQNVNDRSTNQFENSYSSSQSGASHKYEEGLPGYRQTLHTSLENPQYSMGDASSRQPLLATPGMGSSRKPLLDKPDMSTRQPLLATPESSSRQPLLATPEADSRQPLVPNLKQPLLPNPADVQSSHKSSHFEDEFQPSKQFSDEKYHDDYEPKSNVGNFSDETQFSGKRKSLLPNPEGGFGFQRKEYRLGNFNTSSNVGTSDYQTKSGFSGDYSSDRFNDGPSGANTSQNDRSYSSFYNQKNETFDENEPGSSFSSGFVSESFRNFSNNSRDGRYQSYHDDDDEPATQDEYDSYNSPNMNFNRSYQQNSRGGFTRGRGRRGKKFKSQ